MFFVLYFSLKILLSSRIKVKYEARGGAMAGYWSVLNSILHGWGGGKWWSVSSFSHYNLSTESTQKTKIRGARLLCQPAETRFFLNVWSVVFKFVHCFVFYSALLMFVLAKQLRSLGWFFFFGHCSKLKITKNILWLCNRTWMEIHWSTVRLQSQSISSWTCSSIGTFFFSLRVGAPSTPIPPHPTNLLHMITCKPPLLLQTQRPPHTLVYIMLLANTEWTALSCACLSALLRDAPEWRLLKHNFCLLWFHVNVALPSLCVWSRYPCWITEDAGCISSRKEKRFAVCAVVTCFLLLMTLYHLWLWNKILKNESHINPLISERESKLL